MGDIVGNKYRIDGCLGEGGMGVVLSAMHLELDAPVAIKVVREEFADSPDIVSRVLFEARAAARMRSNHVVRVLDVARLDSGCPYIVMEQLEGVDLGFALWERGPFSPTEAIDYLLQACEGLSEAHGLGIVHRDLKPGNLFLANTPEGVVLKVLDFGISKQMSTPLRSVARPSLTSAGDPVGSPYYMAPEQMRASPDVDARADIWSLGAILFELLTGHCPFEGESITEVCSKVMVEDPPSLRAFSNSEETELDSVVARCLQKDPNLRYQTVGEFARALRAWRPSEDVVLDEPVLVPSPKARRPASLPLAMVGLTTLLAIGGVGFWQTRGSAASLDGRAVQPMIAAAAAPIWRALPAPPTVQPEPEAPPAEPKRSSPAWPSAFRAAALKPQESAPRWPALAEPIQAPSATSGLSSPSAPDEAAAEPEALPSASAVDPVSGRYGL